MTEFSENEEHLSEAETLATAHGIVVEQRNVLSQQGKEVLAQRVTEAVANEPKAIAILDAVLSETIE